MDQTNFPPPHSLWIPEVGYYVGPSKPEIAGPETTADLLLFFLEAEADPQKWQAPLPPLSPQVCEEIRAKLKAHGLDDVLLNLSLKESAKVDQILLLGSWLAKLIFTEARQKLLERGITPHASFLIREPKDGDIRVSLKKHTAQQVDGKCDISHERWFQDLCLEMGIPKEKAIDMRVKSHQLNLQVVRPPGSFFECIFAYNLTAHCVFTIDALHCSLDSVLRHEETYLKTFYDHGWDALHDNYYCLIRLAQPFISRLTRPGDVWFRFVKLITAGYTSAQEGLEEGLAKAAKPAECASLFWTLPTPAPDEMAARTLLLCNGLLLLRSHRVNETDLHNIINFHLQKTPPGWMRQALLFLRTPHAVELFLLTTAAPADVSEAPFDNTVYKISKEGAYLQVPRNEIHTCFYKAPKTKDAPALQRLLEGYAALSKNKLLTEQDPLLLVIFELARFWIEQETAPATAEKTPILVQGLQKLILQVAEHKDIKLHKRAQKFIEIAFERKWVSEATYVKMWIGLLTVCLEKETLYLDAIFALWKEKRRVLTVEKSAAFLTTLGEQAYARQEWSTLDEVRSALKERARPEWGEALRLQARKRAFASEETSYAEACNLFRDLKPEEYQDAQTLFIRCSRELQAQPILANLHALPLLIERATFLPAEERVHALCELITLWNNLKDKKESLPEVLYTRFCELLCSSSVEEVLPSRMAAWVSLLLNRRRKGRCEELPLEKTLLHCVNRVCKGDLPATARSMLELPLPREAIRELSHALLSAPSLSPNELFTLEQRFPDEHRKLCAASLRLADGKRAWRHFKELSEEEALPFRAEIETLLQTDPALLSDYYWRFSMDAEGCALGPALVQEREYERLARVALQDKEIEVDLRTTLEALLKAPEKQASSLAVNILLRHCQEYSLYADLSKRMFDKLNEKKLYVEAWKLFYYVLLPNYELLDNQAFADIVQGLQVPSKQALLTNSLFFKAWQPELLQRNPLLIPLLPPLFSQLVKLTAEDFFIAKPILSFCEEALSTNSALPPPYLTLILESILKCLEIDGIGIGYIKNFLKTFPKNRLRIDFLIGNPVENSLPPPPVEAAPFCATITAKLAKWLVLAFSQEKHEIFLDWCTLFTYTQQSQVLGEYEIILKALTCTEARDRRTLSLAITFAFRIYYFSLPERRPHFYPIFQGVLQLFLDHEVPCTPLLWPIVRQLLGQEEWDRFVFKEKKEKFWKKFLVHSVLSLLNDCCNAAALDPQKGLYFLGSLVEKPGCFVSVLVDSAQVQSHFEKIAGLFVTLATHDTVSREELNSKRTQVYNTLDSIASECSQKYLGGITPSYIVALQASCKIVRLLHSALGESERNERALSALCKEWLTQMMVLFAVGPQLKELPQAVIPSDFPSHFDIFSKCLLLSDEETFNRAIRFYADYKDHSYAKHMGLLFRFLCGSVYCGSSFEGWKETPPSDASFIVQTIDLLEASPDEWKNKLAKKLIPLWLPLLMINNS